MSARTPAEVVRELHVSLDARLPEAGGVGWRYSPWPEMLAADPESRTGLGTDRTYSIAYQSWTATGADRGSAARRRGERQALRVDASVMVLWHAGMRIDDPQAAYEEALGYEAELLSALVWPVGVDGQRQPIRVQVTGAQSTVLREGWAQGRITLLVSHHYPLRGG